MTEIANVSNPPPDKVLLDIADYALSYRIDSEAAYDAALLCLTDALSCGFQALQNFACKRLLGPTVPGATLAGGARVPGTSYELDPVQAAFSIGTMIRWAELNETCFMTGRCHAAETLGPILATGDYLSRLAQIQGATTPTMQDVLAAIVKAHEIQSALAQAECFGEFDFDHVMFVRISSAAVSAGLLGCTRDQIIGALSHAWLDGAALQSFRHMSNDVSRKYWAAADAASRGLLHALLALKGDVDSPTSLGAKFGFNEVILKGKTLSLLKVLNSSTMAALPRQAGDRQALQQKLRHSVMKHFPLRQCEPILSMFEDRSKLQVMPVRDFIAKIVRNA